MKPTNIWCVISIAVLAMLMTGCGADCSKTKEAVSDCKSSDTKDVVAAAFKLQGSVTSAFAVTVDGEQFPEMESYFSAEKARLPAKVAEGGYEGWNADFEAEIGYLDLTRGMIVFVQSANQRGYSARGTVGSDGNFSIEMPSQAAGDTYMLKSNKRIAVVLTKDAETKRFCFNFAAVNTNVEYGEKDKPIVLDDFTSTITAYDCPQDSNDGLDLPPNSVTSTAPPPTIEHDAAILTAMAALTPPPTLTDEYIHVPATGSMPIVRRHDKGEIDTLDVPSAALAGVYQSKGSFGTLAFRMFKGLPYIAVTALGGHGLKVGDQIYFTEAMSGLGFEATDLQRSYVIELMPDADTFVVRATKNATATGDLVLQDPTRHPDIIKLTVEMQPKIWASSDGADAAVRSQGGWNYIVKAPDASVCFDSASATATFDWIAAAGSTIDCK